MNLRTVLLSPPLMMEPNIFVIFAILTSTLVSAHFDDVIQGKQKTRLKNSFSSTAQYIDNKTLKVSKSQKHFFLKLHCPKKRTKYLTKFCPMKLGQNFV